MHPAYSVILFTTASGAGYGLLIWLALGILFASVPATWSFGLIGMGLALVLITGGLLSSTAHLGHPERSWRALTQWRSSWLSREGVLAVAAYIPAGLLGIAWVFFEKIDGIAVPFAVLTALLAATTVYSTAMIYASLRTIRAWAQPLTMPNYLLLALASGGLLFNLVLAIFRPVPAWSLLLALVTTIGALLLKRAYWSAIDSAEPKYTAEAATGLGRIGKVRPLEPAHSQPNFVMREMGFAVGRKHAEKLRLAAMALGFGLPVLCLLLAFVVAPVFFTLIAAVSMAAGLVIERWLFFAEAEHVAMLYYGREAA